MDSYFLATQASAEEPPVLKTQKDKLSYATGVEMARSFRRQGIEVDQDLFMRGVKDGLSGGALLMSDDDLNKMLKVFQTEQKMKLAERRRQQAERKRKQTGTGRDPRPEKGPDAPARGSKWRIY